MKNIGHGSCPSTNPSSQKPPARADETGEAGSPSNGFDKIKELDSLVNAVTKHHPATAGLYSGAKLKQQVLQLYFNNAFRDGYRSQEGIRAARRVIKQIENDDALVGRFLKGGLPVGELEEAAEGHKKDKSRGTSDGSELGLVELCKKLNVILTDVDAHNLNAIEQRTLKRTYELISQVLGEIGD